MATSGSTDFDLTRNQIIEMAYRRVGVLAAGQSLTSEQYTTGSNELNLLVKSLQNNDVHFWKVLNTQQTLATASSTVANGGSTYRCILGHTSGASTEPGVGANWTTYWVLSSGSASAWVTATAYTCIADFTLPVRTLSVEGPAFVRQGAYDYNVEVVSFAEYMQGISDKTQEGRPTMLTIDPTDRITKRVRLYPHPDATNYVLHYQRYAPSEDLDSASDNPDMSSNGLELLVCGLTATLSLVYGMPIELRRDYKQGFREALAQYKGAQTYTQDYDFVSDSYINLRGI